MSQVSQVPRKPHRIEAKELPERYARGWYCLGLAEEYTEKPVKLDYFGTRLVAYRGEDGQIHVLARRIDAISGVRTSLNSCHGG